MDVAFETHCRDCGGVFVALFEGFGAEDFSEAFERASDVVRPSADDVRAERAADAVLSFLVEKAQTDEWNEEMTWALEGTRAHPGLLGIRRSVVQMIDGIPFYSVAETKVHGALLQAADRGWSIGIVPNSPVVMRADGKAKVLYPDFQVVLGKKAGIIQVDGSHHRGRAAADHSQDRLLRRAGFAHLERIVVEDTSDEADLTRLVEEFLQFLKEA